LKNPDCEETEEETSSDDPSYVDRLTGSALAASWQKYASDHEE
jgi:hypothetical protein